MLNGRDWKKLVQKGTPNHSHNLCDTCQYLMKVKGHSESQEYRKCYSLGIQLKHKVSDCTNYNMNETFPIYTMEAQAFYLVNTPQGHKKFLSPVEHKVYQKQCGNDEDEDEG